MTNLESHQLKQVEDFIPIMGWGVTAEEALSLLSKLPKALKSYLTKICILYTPSEASIYTGYIGCRIQLLASSEVETEVRKIACTLNF